jgi:type IV secretory pathway VirB2 component (pilin)
MKRRLVRFGIVALVVLGATSAWASSAGMPWETPMTSIVNSVTGPVAKALGALTLLATGFGVAFSEGSHLQRKVLFAVLGLSIAFNATSWGLTFLGFAGGVVVAEAPVVADTSAPSGMA